MTDVAAMEASLAAVADAGIDIRHALFEHEIGIRLNDRERKDVQEYCVSEGWVKVPAGKTLDRRGGPLLIKLTGKVEAFYR